MKYEVLLANKIKTDPKSFYSYVRSKQRTKQSVGPLKDENGTLCNDDESMATLLNRYFATVFTKENMTEMPLLELRQSIQDPNRMVESLLDIEITQSKVENALGKMKENKAAGVDGLTSSYLKSLGSTIVEPLTTIFQQSLSTSEMPDDWKKANITAIFKNGVKSSPGNYRPVSLTSQVGKLMERIIKEELVRHLENNNLILDSQHGFRNKKSCLTNLLEFSEKVAGIIDEGDPVDVVYLDFQKAFDKVPHGRLMEKLRAHGVGGQVGMWVRDWLSGRQQRVVMNGVFSSWEGVFSGVPQGSVLGPILFTIFINDLDDELKSIILKFADDTKLVGRGDKGDNKNERSDVIKGDLMKLEKWSREWEMPFNIDKCKVMHLGNNNKETEYEMGGKKLKKVDEEKDLGILFNNKFKVGAQCLKAANKGNQVLGMISRTFVGRGKKVLLPLYKSLVRPHLDYCIQAWRPHLKKDVDRIERVQRRATRMMEECKGRDYETRLHMTKLTSLEIRAMRADMLEVFKILNKFEGLNESEFFVRDARRGRGNSFKLFRKRVRLDAAKFSFGNRVCTDWNQLPDEVVTAPSINVFKGRLDSYLGKMREVK